MVIDMPLYLFDYNQELMDACEFMLNNGIDLKGMSNFWCLECGNSISKKGEYENFSAWIAYPLKHVTATQHHVARAEPL
jgi:hypothetical protein